MYDTYFKAFPETTMQVFIARVNKKCLNRNPLKGNLTIKESALPNIYCGAINSGSQ